MLQRLPVILAVTAASYGLQVQARGEPQRPAAGGAKASAQQQPDTAPSQRNR